ncbi:CD276 antigen-like [Hemicordylus capensis]|uniref:CD276 antigen-like n=1 Tax=Hemicordylus capensis TaxID=884348 RepID=UPI002303B311|nr:CD276 antigen-like [Hemicordylus capensis]
MPGRWRPLLWWLLFLQSAWTAPRVKVPSSPVRARPGSNAQLPCYISDSSGPLDLSKLVVAWKKDNKNVIKYEGGLTVNRQGAEMTPEQLQSGNATLLLRNIQDSDAADYTCFVVYQHDNEVGVVELRVEAPPQLMLISKKVQLAKPSTVICKVSDFYPGNISAEWRKNDVVVKDRESLLVQHNNDGAFSAESVLTLTAQTADADANFSCHVYHQAVEGLLKIDFQLQVEAPPRLEVTIVPSTEDVMVATCLASGFYPKEVDVQWLRDGKPQLKLQSDHPQKASNGTFSIRSVLLSEKSNHLDSYVCRVKHQALDAPSEKAIYWQPKATSSPPPEICARLVPMFVVLLAGAIAFIVGFLLGAVFMYMCKVKPKSANYQSVEPEPVSKPQTESKMTTKKEDQTTPLARTDCVNDTDVSQL